MIIEEFPWVVEFTPEGGTYFFHLCQEGKHKIRWIKKKGEIKLKCRRCNEEITVEEFIRGYNQDVITGTYLFLQHTSEKELYVHLDMDGARKKLNLPMFLELIENKKLRSNLRNMNAKNGEQLSVTLLGIARGFILMLQGKCELQRMVIKNREIIHAKDLLKKQEMVENVERFFGGTS